MRGVVSRSPLDVLYLTAPGRVGGLETVVLALASGLRGRGHRVTVAAAVERDAAGHPFLDALTAADVKVAVVPEAYGAERRAVRALARETGAGVIHSHGYRSDAQLRLARPRGTPVVTTVHGFTGGGMKNRIYEWVQLRALRGFDAVIAVSKPLEKLLTDSGIPQRVVQLVPNAMAAVSAPVPAPEARVRLAPGVDGPLIGWVGRLGAEKGCDVFLEALGTILHERWTACVIGTGPEAAALADQARRLGLEERVIWAGQVPSAGTLVSAFDLFALSSRTEGTPMVVLEAMEAGVPIVGTSVGGVPDLISASSGWLVAPEDPAALGAAIAEVLGNPGEAARRASVARQTVRSAHAAGPWLDRHEEIYRAVSAR
jgi:glycosyltransferase involved in cell wall biosynthesis